MPNDPNDLSKYPDTPILKDGVAIDVPGDEDGEGKGEGNRPKRSALRRFCRFLLWFFVILAILLLVAAGIIGWMYRSVVTEPIPVEKIEEAEPTELAGWLVLRDLEKETPEIKSKLAEKYFTPIRENVKIDLRTPLAQKLLPLTKKYIETREKTLSDWEATKRQRSFLRRDYAVQPAVDERRVILSTDIAPTDSLRAELKEIADSGNPCVPPPATRTEANIRTLLKNWFFANIARYDAAEEDQKFAEILSTTEQLRRIQKLYNDYLEEIGLERQTDLEMLRDFDFMTSSWYDGTPPEELARLLWYKDLIVSVMVAERAGLTPSEKMIFRPEKKKSKLGGLINHLLDREEEK